MRSIFGIPMVALLTSCSFGNNTQDKASTDLPSDTDDPVVVEDTGPEPVETDFTASRFKLASLELADPTEGVDIDGDGDVDNKFPSILTSANLLYDALDVSPAAVNARIVDNLAQGVIIILLDVNLDEDGTLHVAFINGLPDVGGFTPDPESWDENGDPRMAFEGRFLTEDTFKAGPGRFQMPVKFVDYLDPVRLQLEDARLEGTLTEDASAGWVAGVIPVTAMVQAVIEPLVPDVGYDIDNDGVLEPESEVLALFEQLGTAAADMDLGPMGPGISISMRYTAIPTSW